VQLEFTSIGNKYFIHTWHALYPWLFTINDLPNVNKFNSFVT